MFSLEMHDYPLEKWAHWRYFSSRSPRPCLGVERRAVPADDRSTRPVQNGRPTSEGDACEADQVLSDLDQTHSDSDQTASDADQTAADSDEAASRADQHNAEVDQEASDHDQEAADREEAAGDTSDEQEEAYDESRAERADATEARNASAAARATSELARSRQALARDETARGRDLTAIARDRAAAARDRAAARRAAKFLNDERASDPTIRALLAASEAVRERAAADRARAAQDRERAAADREQAALDRRRARVELQRAQLDSLTGVHTRDLGETTLQHEIDRCRRSGEPFVLAFIDVDGLKDVNDREGHPAGDALLQSVVEALRSRLRSYDPVVRVGGDEFICGFTNTDIDASQRRAEEIQAAVEQGPAHGSIAIGLASLGPEDTLEDLTARADADMYAHKQGSRGEAAANQ
jgi:diguanylate cyclase (GGDEF)-like protein